MSFFEETSCLLFLLLWNIILYNLIYLPLKISRSLSVSHICISTKLECSHSFPHPPSQSPTDCCFLQEKFCWWWEKCSLSFRNLLMVMCVSCLCMNYFWFLSVSHNAYLYLLKYCILHFSALIYLRQSRSRQSLFLMSYA